MSKIESAPSVQNRTLRWALKRSQIPLSSKLDAKISIGICAKVVLEVIALNPLRHYTCLAPKYCAGSELSHIIILVQKHSVQKIIRKVVRN